MASESDSNSAKEILSALNNPQFKSVIGITVTLGVLLLFARDLGDASGFRNYLIGALAVYLISTLFLVQTQINLINHARNQAGENPEHLPSASRCPAAQRHPWIKHILAFYGDVADVLGHFLIRCINLLHGVLLLLLIFYLFWRGCL